MHLVSATRFKSLNRNRKITAASAVGVRKQMIAPIEQLASDDRSLRFTISTGIVDREQDTIAVAGWDLSAFLRNPVVLWGHDSAALPIGRALDVGLQGSALKATVRFIPADTPERGQFAEAVYQLARQGFISATSVGFRPLQWDYTDDPERGADDWFPGIDFQRQELVELSIVTVPANPEALMDEPLPAPAQPAEIASDTPPVTGEEITALDLNGIQERLARGLDDLDERLAILTANKEKATARARRMRVLQLAQASLQMHRYAVGAR